MKPRKTLQEMAQGSGANVCARCNGVMIVYKTIRLDTRIIRYRRCKNPKCPNSVITKQEHEEIVRDVDRHDSEDSDAGIPRLTLARNIA